MPTYLKALALSSYRGIDSNYEVMVDFNSFNFFIGANNAGKSTILNFISRYLPPCFTKTGSVQQAQSYVIDDLERHGGNANKPIRMAIGFSASDVLHYLSLRFPSVVDDQTHKQNLIKLIDHLSSNGWIWKSGVVPYGEMLNIHKPEIDTLKTLFDYHTWNRLWMALTNHTGGDISAHWIPEILGVLDKTITIDLPPVRIIPAIRQVGPKGAVFEDYSGVGLIDRLAAIQNPEHNLRSERLKFDRINSFLQSVTGKDGAKIEIPYSRQHILVHMDNRVLPLSSLGTGIHEVVMIAAFCTLAENELICVEEPEIHLHPLLQRKLIRYLSDNTENQYFIATHSTSFIDTPGAAIFHVYQEEDTTHIRKAVLKKERYAICMDLGHRASDIIQSNAVLWVEGPSDRIYLNHWINIADPTLVEGVHYSIMFYGGRLLSHLTADDEDVSDFIQLRDLNRNVAILMDSDKKNAQSKINATKLRLQSEFSRHGGIAWMTKGREVENYIDHARLQRAVGSVYQGVYDAPHLGGQFDHALIFRRLALRKRRIGTPSLNLIETDIDKVKVSRAVVSDGSRDLDVLDLRAKVSEIVALVHRANSVS